jgi:hypothetical protein
MIADIMMIASPAPPASCMVLRQRRIIGPQVVTSTTESPVVVHPLIDSKTARENGSPRAHASGHAEKRTTTTQLARTMTPPSERVSVTGRPGRKHRRSAKPRAARTHAGTTKAHARGSSPGYAMRARRGESIKALDRRKTSPAEERTAA